MAASSSLNSHIRLWDIESGKSIKSIDAGPGKQLRLSSFQLCCCHVFFYHKFSDFIIATRTPHQLTKIVRLRLGSGCVDDLLLARLAVSCDWQPHRQGQPLQRRDRQEGDATRYEGQVHSQPRLRKCSSTQPRFFRRNCISFPKSVTVCINF